MPNSTTPMNPEECTTKNSISIVRSAYFSTPSPKNRGATQVTRKTAPRAASGSAESARARTFDPPRPVTIASARGLGSRGPGRRSARQARIEDVAQAVAEQVEAEDGQG